MTGKPLSSVHDELCGSVWDNARL